MAKVNERAFKPGIINEFTSLVECKVIVDQLNTNVDLPGFGSTKYMFNDLDSLTKGRYSTN